MMVTNLCNTRGVLYATAGPRGRDLEPSGG
jgi:hypothetical protein